MQGSPAFADQATLHASGIGVEFCKLRPDLSSNASTAGFMFTGAAVVSGGGNGESGMLEGLIIEKLNGWDIEKRYVCLDGQDVIDTLTLSVCHSPPASQAADSHVSGMGIAKNQSGSKPLLM